MSEAKKFDTGKPMMSLLSPYALEQVAMVLTFGAEKYDKHNWRKGMDWSRLLDASMRHINAFNNGEDIDQESGLPHIAHAMCCLMMLLTYTKDNKNLDDRYKGVENGTSNTDSVDTPTKMDGNQTGDLICTACGSVLNRDRLEKSCCGRCGKS